MTMGAPPGQGDGPPLPHPQLHDVVVQRSKRAAKAVVEPVPPEEFGVSRTTRSLRECDYSFHKVLISESRLLAQGYDKKQVKALPSYSGATNTEEISRDTVNEYQYAADNINRAARRIEVVEHYIRMDYDGTGEAKLYKVTTGGSQGEILRKKIDDDDAEGAGKKKKAQYREDIEEFDLMPFAAMTPVIMTHRFFGRSIADLVMDIMRIKTALMRGMLDNLYLSNNPRVEVAEPAGTDALDDLLVARPGGIIRTKQPGMIQWQEVPNVAANAFPALEYMDQTREWRTGVTRQGQGIDSHALQNQSATAVSQVYSMAQARIKLIARIFAETGIKDLFILLHGMIRKHGQEAQTVRLRNQWVQVDPRDWKNRNDLTVHVGLGDGSKTEQIAHVQAVIELQARALLSPLTATLVKADNFYNSAKQMVKLVGLKDATKFFTDPATAPPPPPAPPDPALVKVQAQMQLEQVQEDKEMRIEAAKAQAQMAVNAQKHQSDMQLAELNARIKVEQHAMDMALQQQKMQHAAAAETRKAAEKPAPSVEVKHNTADFAAPISEAIAKLAEMHQASTHAIIAATQAPKRRVIVRDQQGRVSHADEIPVTH